MATNVAATGSISILLFGANFGLFSSSSFARGGFTDCEQTAWISETVIAGLFSSGVGTVKDIVVSVAVGQGTATSLFTFHAPAVSDVRLGNGQVSDAAQITLHGLGFGHSSYTTASRLSKAGEQDDACGTSEWVSETAVTCKPPVGDLSSSNGERDLIVTVALQFQTISAAFTYDEGKLTGFEPSNSPTESGQITFFGLNWGVSDFCPLARVGGSACEETVWFSDTAATCKTSGSLGIAQPVTLTLQLVSTVIDTLTSALTFDGPSVSSIQGTNSPAIGQITLSLFGDNFGPFDFSAGLRMGITSSQSSNWIGDTCVLGQSAAGAGGVGASLATVAVQPSTYSLAFSYHRASISDVSVITGCTSCDS
eukprot:3938764-Rhodomonas_salina.1